MCEVRNQKYITLFNTIQDDIVKRSYYTDNDSVYFERVLEELMNTPDHKLSTNECLNLIPPNTQVKPTQAQILLNKWIDDGYFVKLRNIVYIGPRTIHEFNTKLRSNSEDKVYICTLCRELTFVVSFIRDVSI